MNNVLMVTYAFPPAAGTEVRRTLKYTKYLPHYGWNPIILTIQKDERYLEIFDNSLFEELPKDLKIYRSNVIEHYDLYRFFGGKKKHGSGALDLMLCMNKLNTRIAKFIHSLFIPDGQIGWYPFAIKKSAEIFSKHNIDAIYSTSPVETAHFIAKSIAQTYKKPWVADFRDPWVRTAFVPEKAFLLRKLNMLMEKSVFERANKIVAAWPNIICDLRERYGDFDDEKAVVISNGFDEQDFLDIIPKTFKKFTIIFTGRLHIKRSAKPLLIAISLLLSEKPLLENDFQIIFVGRPEPSTKKLVKEMQLGSIVKIIPNLPHKECLSYLLGASLLFLNSLEDYVPAKLFEYLRAKKPILALVPAYTTVAKIITSTQSGIVVDPSDTEKIKDTISEMYKKYERGVLELHREDDSAIYQYERKHLAGKLSKILDELV